MGIHSHSRADLHGPRIRHLPLTCDPSAEASDHRAQGSADISANGHAALHLPEARHASPWTNRVVLLVGLVGVVVLAPLWLDPTTFDQLRAVSPTTTPLAVASPAPLISGLPSADPGLLYPGDRARRLLANGQRRLGSGRVRRPVRAVRGRRASLGRWAERAGGTWARGTWQRGAGSGNRPRRDGPIRAGRRHSARRQRNQGVHPGSRRA